MLEMEKSSEEKRRSGMKLCRSCQMLTDGLIISVTGSLRSSLLTEQSRFWYLVWHLSLQSLSSESVGEENHSERRPSWRLSMKPLDLPSPPSIPQSDSISRFLSHNAQTPLQKHAGTRKCSKVFFLPYTHTTPRGSGMVWFTSSQREPLFVTQQHDFWTH